MEQDRFTEEVWSEPPGPENTYEVPDEEAADEAEDEEPASEDEPDEDEPTEPVVVTPDPVV